MYLGRSTTAAGDLGPHLLGAELAGLGLGAAVRVGGSSGGVIRSTLLYLEKIRNFNVFHVDPSIKSYCCSKCPISKFKFVS